MRKKRTYGHLALALLKCRRYSLITCCDTVAVQCNGALPINASRPQIAQMALESTHQQFSLCGDLESGRRKKPCSPGSQGPLPLFFPRPREVSRVSLVQPTYSPQTLQPNKALLHFTKVPLVSADRNGFEGHNM